MIRQLLAASAIALAATPALAADDWYAGVFALGGFSDTDGTTRSPAGPAVTDSTDTNGISGGAGIWGGHKMGDYSIELSGAYRYRHDMNISFTDITTSGSYGTKANVETFDLMLSGLYDIPLGYKLQPYVGAGAGLVYLYNETELDNGITRTDGGSNSDLNFAWQLQTGLKYPVSDNALVRLDYRYIDMGKVTTGTQPTPTNDRFTSDLFSHDIRLGMTWAF